jgi:hypothetical protein
MLPLQDNNDEIRREMGEGMRIPKDRDELQRDSSH